MGIHIPVFVLTSPNQQSTVVFNFSLQQIKYTEQHGATHNYPCGASHPRDHRKSIACHRGVQGRLYAKGGAEKKCQGICDYTDAYCASDDISEADCNQKCEANIPANASKCPELCTMVIAACNEQMCTINVQVAQ